jgi:uncharacterized protein (TIGR03067 family)
MKLFGLGSVLVCGDLAMLKCSLVVLMAAAAASSHASEAEALLQLQGTWEIVSGERDGRAFVETELVTYAKRILIVKDDTFAWNSTAKGRLASGKLVEIKGTDFTQLCFRVRTGPDSGDESLSIVQFGKDQVKICYSDSHRGWPKTFDTTGREGYTTVIYEKKLRLKE